MAPKNDFLIFNENELNLLSQEEYDSDTQRLNGVTSGLARSALFNKIFLQTSIMASAIGEVAKNRGEEVDDTDFVDLVAALTAAFPKTYYGRYSQMSGTTERVGNGAGSGLFEFSSEDNDDFEAIDLVTNTTRFTIPAEISKVRFTGFGKVARGTATTDSIQLYKNGSYLQDLLSTIGQNSLNVYPAIEASFDSGYVSVTVGDYFELYGYMSGVGPYEKVNVYRVMMEAVK